MIIQEKYNNTLIKTYAETEGIRYKIKKVGTDEIYNEAIDLPNETRLEKGLEPYYYEETAIEVEIKEENTQEELI